MSTPIRRRITLLRHGAVEYIDENGDRVDPDLVPLTSAGRDQAAAAQVALAEVPFDAVMTSGLLRTMQTAEIVLGERSLDITTLPDLEEIRPGTFEEVETEEEMRATIVDGFRNAQDGGRFLTGEAYEAFHERVLRGFADVLGRSEWRELLLVLHGGVNRALLSEVLGAGRRSWGAIEQEACCINVIDLDFGADEPFAEVDLPRRAWVRLMNHTPYAADKNAARLTTLEELWRRFSGEA